MMKIKQIVAVMLIAFAALSLVGCSNYKSVKKAFEKEGYTEVEEVNDYQNSFYSYIDEEKEEELGIKIFVHVFTKKGDILSTVADAVIILEFDCNEKKMREYIEDSDTLKGFIKDAQKSEYVNGTCIFIPNTTTAITGGSKALDIFKKA
ncbi:MAG: hypothetical protein J6Z34_05730 [Clostridia bacterium]|nr:hypothetical protein [Clostridia bacterium]